MSRFGFSTFHLKKDAFDPQYWRLSRQQLRNNISKHIFFTPSWVTDWFQRERSPRTAERFVLPFTSDSKPLSSESLELSSQKSIPSSLIREACWRCSSSCFCKSSPTLDIRGWASDSGWTAECTKHDHRITQVIAFNPNWPGYFWVARRSLPPAWVDHHVESQ